MTQPVYSYHLIRLRTPDGLGTDDQYDATNRFQEALLNLLARWKPHLKAFDLALEYVDVDDYGLSPSAHEDFERMPPSNLI